MMCRHGTRRLEPLVVGATLAMLFGGDVGLSATPDLETPATYRTFSLEADFWPDPEAVSVVAGGADPAIALGSRCTGFIHAAAADISLTLDDHLEALFISAHASIDTTLLVHAPDDTWHCNDDTLGTDPLVALTPAGAGRYHVWVGTIEPESATAVVFFSETDPRDETEPVAESAGHHGSGFFVSTSGHLVTNAHVVEGCASITVVGHGPAELVAADAGADLALLRVDGYAGPAAAFQTDPPQLASDILLFGFPLAGLLDGLSVTAGVVSSLSGLDGDRQTFIFSAPLQQGNSGGPLLDSGGLVVGVAAGKLDEIVEIGRSGSMPQNINYAVRGDVVRAFLAANGVVASQAPGDDELPRQQIAARGAAVTVLLDCSA
jgi:S1-C subfamily serine protease